MHATSVTTDPVIPSNSNLHEPFLRRAADATDGHTSGVALGGFLTLRLVDVFDQRLEQVSVAALSYQIEATRDYLNDLYPSTAEVKHLQEIVGAAEAAFEERNRRLLWPSLLAFAFWLEQEIRLDEALDVLDSAMALGEGVPAEEEVATQLQRARVTRLQGHYEEARGHYAQAGQMARGIGDDHSERLSRIGLGIVLQMKGNLPESEKVLQAVLGEARRAGDTDAEARASHDLSVTYYYSGRHREGIPLAFRAYELHTQERNRLRALSDLGMLLKGVAQLRAAEDAFRLVAHWASQHDIRALATNELIEIASLRGDRVGFERWRRSVADVLGALPPEVQADYYVKCGEGLGRFEDIANARSQLHRAVEIATRHGMNQLMFQAEGALANLDAEEMKIPASRAAEPADDPQVDVVVSRLEELSVELVG